MLYVTEVCKKVSVWSKLTHVDKIFSFGHQISAQLNIYGMFWTKTNQRIAFVPTVLFQGLVDLSQCAMKLFWCLMMGQHNSVTFFSP